MKTLRKQTLQNGERKSTWSQADSLASPFLWPHVKRKWIEVIQWLIDNGYTNNNEDKVNGCESFFRWWISGKSFDKFYADEFIQQKIDFEKHEGTDI